MLTKLIAFSAGAVLATALAFAPTPVVAATPAQAGFIGIGGGVHVAFVMRCHYTADGRYECCDYRNNCTA